ncbi:hypothetical protein HELRODRAFT_75396 [Helobdella robusta]|uniref:Trafficking protein particle complex subunit 13 n=1 Tax=Helobdella robusta TaxID=6412 RepID=T1G246_HELRO|nr:hypothetical protein HELRODRAFT_75396 [Helobdella robusta]ESO08098.1 hypothetical protein HELRODRAFT_75396 [Helobdella robusta]
MRLTKPTLSSSSSSLLQCDPRDMPNNSFEINAKLETDVLPNFNNISLGRCIILPQNFGNIFLGETFTSYISVNNESDQICTDVQIKAELQTSSQRLVLNVPGQTRSELQPGSSIDEIIQHEVKELGTHILVCAVNYNTPHVEKMHFRKFFKFHVLKPLDVKTKFYSVESDEIFLEAQLQNITPNPMFLERVSLEPSSPYKVESLNDVHTVTGSNQTIFDPVVFINSQDTRQYLYKLTMQRQPATTTSNNNNNTYGLFNIGKLDIVWKSNMGERGRLQTSQLQRVAPGTGDLKVKVIRSPAEVMVGVIYSVAVSITNCCERPMDLVVSLHSNHRQGYAWCGLSGQPIGRLEIGASTVLDLEIMILITGLISVSGLHITDQFLKRTYENDDVFQLLAYDGHGYDYDDDDHYDVTNGGGVDNDANVRAGGKNFEKFCGS